MPHTLLLADDSVTIQRVIELTFADEDVRVVAVGDGRQAIDKIVYEPPDIVLADVGMPGCDGYEVSAFVKDRPEFAHIPVLLLTGAFEPVDEARVRQVKADGVLAKPFEPHELITRVKDLLGVGAGQPAAGISVPVSAPASAPAARAADATPDEHDAPSVAAPGLGLPPSAAGGVSLDDYFDRLDAAFASLSVPSHIDEAASVPRPAPEAAWREHEPGADAPPGHVPAAGTAPSPAGRSPSPQSATVGGLSPAEAFAAFLDAEQAGPQAPAAGAGLVGTVLPPAYPPVDELVALVATRVLAQLSDRVVRESVADVVSQVAERLVREEIERLKSAIG
jgi:CheY-like chemotaxis protein